MLYSTKEAAHAAGREYLERWSLQRWNPCLVVLPVTVMDGVYFLWRLSIPQNYLKLHLYCTTDGVHRACIEDQTVDSDRGPREAIRELVRGLGADLEYRMETLECFEQHFPEGSDCPPGGAEEEVVEETTTTPMWELLREGQE